MVYRLELGAPTHVTAQVTNAGFQPSVSLREACYRNVAAVACSAGDEAAAVLDGPGRAFVVVDALGGGAGAFTLQVDLDVDARDAKCQGARDVVFVAGEATVEGLALVSTHQSAELAAQGCADVGASAAAPEAVYRLEVPQPARLTVEVEAITNPGILYLLRPLCSEQDEVACGTGDTPLDAVLLAAGTHYLVVDSLDPDGPGSFSLAVGLVPE